MFLRSFRCISRLERATANYIEGGNLRSLAAYGNMFQLTKCGSEILRLLPILRWARILLKLGQCSFLYFVAALFS